MRWSPALTRGGGQGMADGAAGGGGGGAGIRGGEEEDSPEKKENGLTHISLPLFLRRGCSPFLLPCNIQCIPPPVPDRVIAPLPPSPSIPSSPPGISNIVFTSESVPFCYPPEKQQLYSSNVITAPPPFVRRSMMFLLFHTSLGSPLNAFVHGYQLSHLCTASAIRDRMGRDVSV